MNAIKSAENPSVPNTNLILPSIFLRAIAMRDFPFIIIIF